MTQITPHVLLVLSGTTDAQFGMLKHKVTLLHPTTDKKGLAPQGIL